MANDRDSDRRRLLKLIDGDPSTLKGMDSEQKAADASRKVREFAYVAKAKASEALARLRRGDISLSWLRHIPLNGILAAVLAAMSAYLVLSFIGTTVFRKGNAIPPSSSYEHKAAPSFTELNPLGFYLDEISNKDIFNPQRLANAPAAESNAAEGSVSGLKLVGVDWGEQPIAMIEDTQAGKTYFVKKGDSIKGIRVIEVMKDRVKINYNNKYIELR